MQLWVMIVVVYVVVGVSAAIWDAVNAARRQEDESIALSLAVGAFWPIVIVLALFSRGTTK